MAPGMVSPFPSDAWFTELADRAGSDRTTLEHLGTADLRLGIEVVAPSGDTTLYGLVLDGYDVRSEGAVTERSFAPEAVVSGPLEAWQEMVAAIETHGAADTAHTLNSLSLAGVPLEVRGGDAMGHDKFFRFMGTIQAVFDAAGARAPVVAG